MKTDQVIDYSAEFSQETVMEGSHSAKQKSIYKEKYSHQLAWRARNRERYNAKMAEYMRRRRAATS